MDDLMQIIAEQKIPIIEMKDGISWTAGKTAFAYLSPQDEDYVGNDSSLALLMKTSGPSFLFTGDMETDAEEKFLRKYGEVKFNQIILKVAHHGSKTSSTEPFIDAIRPQLSIISAGRNNSYGHPHQEVLETFQKFGLPTMITAENGSITVSVTKKDYTVSAIAE